MALSSPSLCLFACSCFTKNAYLFHISYSKISSTAICYKDNWPSLAQSLRVLDRYSARALCPRWRCTLAKDCNGVAVLPACRWIAPDDTSSDIRHGTVVSVWNWKTSATADGLRGWTVFEQLQIQKKHKHTLLYSNHSPAILAKTWLVFHQ